MAAAYRPRLSPEHRSKVSEVLELAEELTAEHFKLPSFDSERFAYDVLTLDDLAPEEITDGAALAVLHRYARGVRHGGAPRSFFRICLQDHNILATLDREQWMPFDDLLLFILTHELVHIARFGSFQQIFEAPEERRITEERAVHEITSRILAGLKRSSMDRIVALWSGTGGPDLIRDEVG